MRNRNSKGQFEKQKNNIIQESGFVYLELQNGKYGIIDDFNYELIKDYNCWCESDGYIRSELTRSKHIKLHRLIMGITDPKIQVDHIDGNKLNNTISNLRICNNQQNSLNSGKQINNNCGYIGVYLNKNIIRNKEYFYWQPSIRINGKNKKVGNFPYTEQGLIDAAVARDKAIIELHGKEFVKLNFPELF